MADGHDKGQDKRSFMVSSVRVACVLGTCDILRVHSLPFGRESSIREATVGLKCDRYRVAGADQDGGEDVTTVCAWKWSRARREKKGKMEMDETMEPRLR